MALSIDKFLKTETAEPEKTASENTETTMEKTAADHALEVIDQSGKLVAIGENLQKFAAEDAELAALGAIGEDLFNIGSRMGSALSKTAAEEPHALFESLEIAEDLHKVASVFAELVDAVQDEELSKDASEVIGIANVLTDEANEFYTSMENDEKTAGLSELKAKVMAHAKSLAEKGKKGAEHVKEHVKEHKTKYMSIGAGTAGIVGGYEAGKHTKK